jgi:two-component system sensor histidine kinase KdpD
VPLSDTVEVHLQNLMRGPRRSAARRLSFAVAVAATATALTTAAAWAIARAGYLSPDALSLLFVLPVLSAAIWFGVGAGLFTALAAVVAYNIAVLPPAGEIGWADPQNLLKGAILVLIAATAGGLAQRIRTLAAEALDRERTLSAVYALSQAAVGISDLDQMRRTVEDKLGTLLGALTRIVLLGEAGADTPAVRTCLAVSAPVGRGTPFRGQDDALILPMVATGGPLGVLMVADLGPAPLAQRFPRKVLATMAAQAAAVIEKARIAEDQRRMSIAADRERFLSALLSSVSHDLKTPLVTVIGALGSLDTLPAVRSESGLRQVVAAGLEQAQRLNRFITNLVEISRLEAGIESMRREPTLLRDLLASALRTLKPLLGTHRIAIDVPADFPLLDVNPALMELVFLNLLENAVKYGPRDGEIKIIARTDQDGATIDVDDDGPGIPPSERAAIFVKFYRSSRGDRTIAGTGLGLYICREIARAHGGTVEAIDPHDGQGACVRLRLPAEVLVPMVMPREPEDA